MKNSPFVGNCVSRNDWRRCRSTENETQRIYHKMTETDEVDKVCFCA